VFSHKSSVVVAVAVSAGLQVEALQPILVAIPAGKNHTSIILGVPDQAEAGRAGVFEGLAG
jgi:hypothetical protein